MATKTPCYTALQRGGLGKALAVISYQEVTIGVTGSLNGISILNISLLSPKCIWVETTYVRGLCVSVEAAVQLSKRITSGSVYR